MHKCTWNAEKIKQLFETVFIDSFTIRNESTESAEPSPTSKLLCTANQNLVPVLEILICGRLLYHTFAWSCCRKGWLKWDPEIKNKQATWVKQCRCGKLNFGPSVSKNHVDKMAVFHEAKSSAWLSTIWQQLQVEFVYRLDDMMDEFGSNSVARCEWLVKWHVT